MLYESSMRLRAAFPIFWRNGSSSTNRLNCSTHSSGSYASNPVFPSVMLFLNGSTLEATVGIPIADISSHLKLLFARLNALSLSGAIPISNRHCLMRLGYSRMSYQRGEEMQRLC